jgi:poly-gamma-glutamate capsule biosynthesis protein CapA/YwtB (metallophosphatase superfamily)
VLLTGDIRLGSNIGPNVSDATEPFAHVQHILRNDNVVFGNLEGALYDEIDPHVYFSKVHWTHSARSRAEALRAGNFCVVGIANNVTVGDAAIRSTLDVLDGMGIAHTGAGVDMGSARAAAIVERDGVRYGFLQRTSIFWPFHHRAVPDGPVRMPDSTRYTHGLFEPGSVMNFIGAPGVSTLRPRTAYEPSYASMYEGGGDAIIHTWPDPDELQDFTDDVSALRTSVDVLVTSHHWRLTGTDIARDYRREIAHAAIDAGADIVVGHGNHELDAIEIYRGRPILYGLGEFFFRSTAWAGDETRRGLIVSVDLDGGSVRHVRCLLVGRASPMDDRPLIRDASEDERGVEQLKLRCQALGTAIRVEGDSITIAEGTGVTAAEYDQTAHTTV